MPDTSFADHSTPRWHRRQAGSVNLPLVVALVLVLGIAVRLGIGGRVLLGPADLQASLPAAVVSDRAALQADPAVLRNLNLFSGAPAQNAAAVNPGPVARNSGQAVLNLRLEGVILATPPEHSVAIIVNSAVQGSYRSGESLPAGEEVKLESIQADHVVVSNRGQRETLWLYEGKDAESGNAANAAQTTAQLPNGMAGSLRTAANNLTSPDAAVSRAAAASLAEVISVSPAQQNGNLIGYRLTPGARLKDFVQLGFRTNDVVTAVNGIPLNDMANLPQLYSLMNDASEVSFSLLREGQPLNLQVSLAAP